MEEAFEKVLLARERATNAMICWGIWAGLILLTVLFCVIDTAGGGVETAGLMLGGFCAPPFLLAAFIISLRSMFTSRNGRAILVLALCLLGIAVYVWALQPLATIQC